MGEPPPGWGDPVFILKDIESNSLSFTTFLTQPNFNIIFLNRPVKPYLEVLEEMLDREEDDKDDCEQTTEDEEEEEDDNGYEQDKEEDWEEEARDNCAYKEIFQKLINGESIEDSDDSDCNLDD